MHVICVANNARNKSSTVWQTVSKVELRFVKTLNSLTVLKKIKKDLKDVWIWIDWSLYGGLTQGIPNHFHNGLLPEFHFKIILKQTITILFDSTKDIVILYKQLAYLVWDLWYMCQAISELCICWQVLASARQNNISCVINITHLPIYLFLLTAASNQILIFNALFTFRQIVDLTTTHDCT